MADIAHLLHRPGFDWQRICRHLSQAYPRHAWLPLTLVSVAEQRLYLIRRMNLLGSYRISSSRYGTGTLMGSQKTPTGTHCVAQKIGDNQPVMTVFAARQATGEIARINKTRMTGVDDLICSRILWLTGLEKGHNLGGCRDSMRRYIYIHGTPDEKHIGTPASCGCIRMKNNEICELFDLLKEGSLVHILAHEHGKKSYLRKTHG